MKIKLKSSAKRVLANVFSAKVDDGNALIPENIRKDVKIFDVVGTYGTAPVTPEDLTPFTVGQTINGVTIDPNAKTDEEIADWLNNLTNEQRLVEFSDGASGIAVVEFNGVKTMSMFLNPIWVVFSVDAESDFSIPKGWSYAPQMSEHANFTPITERTTLNFDTLEVTQVYSEFDFLNGVAVGAVETEAPTTTLTNIEVGQRLKGIKFDTSKTPDLSQYTMMGEYGVCLLINSTNDYKDPQNTMFVVADLSTIGLGSGRAIFVAGTQIAYSTIEIADYSGQYIPQGWNYNYLDENGIGLFKESDVEPLQYVNVTEVIDGHLWNGIFAGAVLADSEPETPTTFIDGQTINGVTVSPNVKTDDEMIEWLNGFSETTVLVDVPRAEVQIPLTGAKTFSIALSENKQIMFVPEDTTIKGSPVTKGWHCLEGTETSSSQELISRHSTYSGDTYTVTGVTEAFAFLNGSVLGAVEATDVPTETLTPFTVGQDISAIKVDTNARTNEKLSAIVAKLDSGSGIEKSFMTYFADNEPPIITVQGDADFGYLITTKSNTKGDSLIWVSKAMEVDSVMFESAGWYFANENTKSAKEVSGIVKLLLGETITVGNIDDAFEILNGTVFGAVAAVEA